MPGWIHRKIANALMRFRQRVIEKDSPRLMIFLPPRVGKSLIVSEYLPSFLLGHNPDWHVLACSAGDDLVGQFGRTVRNTMLSEEYHNLFPASQLSPDSTSAELFNLRAGGRYKGAGVGAQIVGFGSSVGIIDDPYRNRAQAYSLAERERLWKWFLADFYTRLMPGGGIILMHQRWHKDDIAGRILSGPNAKDWEVLSFPAIAEEDEEFRKKGEALHPERWPVRFYEDLRRNLSPDEWLAMYQQRPVAEGGGFFKREWFNFRDPPKGCTWVLGGDYAVSKSTRADRSAVVAVGFHPDGNTYLHPEVIYERLESLDSVRRTLAFAKKIGARRLCTEKGPIDAALGPIFREEMRKTDYALRIDTTSRSSGKHIVAAPYQARLSAGSLFVPDRTFFKEVFIPQHLNFVPEATGGEDDLIDAAANVFAADHLPRPTRPEISKPPTAEEDEEEMWEEIMRRGGEAKKAPFTKLNGDPIK